MEETALIVLRAAENLKPGDQLRDDAGKLWVVAGMAVHRGRADDITVSLRRDNGETHRIELRYGDTVQIANVL